MAVPSAIKRQRERLEAELAAGAIPAADEISAPVNPDVDTEVPAAPEVIPAPVVSEPPTDVTAFKTRIAELEHLLKTRDGQTSKATRDADEARSRADILAAQVSHLEEAVAEIQKQKDTVEALATAKRVDADFPSMDEVGDISPEEREKFGDDSVAFVSKLSNREQLKYIKPLLAKVQALEKSLARLSDLDRLPQLESAVKNSQAEAQRVKDDEFFREEVLAHYPDFPKTKDSPEWKAYITTELPGKGMKIGNLLNHYRLMHDPVNIRAVIQGFYDHRGQNTSLASLAVPKNTQTEGTPVSKPKYKASEYQAKLKQWYSKQLPQAEWDKFKTVFNTAMDEGRVEMDARL
jgi:hypothetical protein